jgi:hypothetical protein
MFMADVRSVERLRVLSAGVFPLPTFSLFSPERSARDILECGTVRFIAMESRLSPINRLR